jgi:urea transporter
MALFRLLWRRSSSYSATASHQRYRYQLVGSISLLNKHQRHQRCCASTDKERDDEEERKLPLPKSISALMATAAGRQQLLQTAGTGTSQVIFVNSRDNAGAVILLSLALGDPAVAFLAGVGSLASTVTAITTLSGGTRKGTTSANTIENGLFSYNGCLVGCATAGLICPGSIAAALPLTVAGAATSTYLTALLMKSPMPQWTIAFNIFTYTTLLALSSSKNNTGSSESVTVVADAVVGVAASSTSYLDLFVSPMTGLAQIFVVESAWSGLGICLVLARYSPQLAGHAVLGSAVGSLTGSILLGADPHSIAAGLWGYNSALTSIGTAVFLRSNNTVWLVSGVGAALTAVTFGAMSAVSPVPCLTIPFCTVMSAVWWLAHGQWVNGITLAKNPHSPERNHD